jgi:hypothetical protein
MEPAEYPTFAELKDLLKQERVLLAKLILCAALAKENELWQMAQHFCTSVFVVIAVDCSAGLSSLFLLLKKVWRSLKNWGVKISFRYSSLVFPSYAVHHASGYTVLCLDASCGESAN